MKLVPFLLLSGGICFAEELQRPVCNAQTRGQFWPAEANQSREALREIAQQGGLQLCSHGTWKYSWKPVSVNVRDLARTKAQTAGREEEKAAERYIAAPHY